VLAVLCVLVLASNASKKNCLELYVHELPAMKTSSDRIAKDGTRHQDRSLLPAPRLEPAGMRIAAPRGSEDVDTASQQRARVLINIRTRYLFQSLCRRTAMFQPFELLPTNVT